MFDINEVLNIFFSKGEVKKLKKFANVYENGDKLKKEFIEVWRYDQQISGIGGYFMPLFTPINPFNYYGRWRNVFRSIQYGRSDIFYNQRPRTLVEDSGLHLESLLKVLFYRFDNKMTLGKILEKQYKKESISYDEYRKIRVLKKIWNISKHDTSATRNITFTHFEAIVFYFAVRKISTEILENRGHPLAHNDYDICYVIYYRDYDTKLDKIYKDIYRTMLVSL